MGETCSGRLLPVSVRLAGETVKRVDPDYPECAGGNTTEPSAGLVSIGIVGALSAMSGSITGLFSSISSTLSGAASG